MNIQLPEKVRKIISVIEAAGFEAYAVGGCVRDSILGRTPDDWDITTSAQPMQIKELFPRTVDTGIKHGTVTVIMAGEGFEVTTYRIDGEYEDGRHPKEVLFTSELTKDLMRRDFTVNAMAYSEKKGLIDRFGGMEDIKKGVIRCVGNPQERFAEDALRIMRAVRFCAQLGYKIETETQRAVERMAGSLTRVSAERIQIELCKIAVSPNPGMLKLAWSTGIIGVILPEFDQCMKTLQNNPHHSYSVGEHILHSMEATRPDKVLRLSMLFHDIGKPQVKTTDVNGIDHFHGHAAAGTAITRQIMKRFKFDNDTLFKVSELVCYHDYDIHNTSQGVRRAVHNVGENLFPLLLEVKQADLEAQSLYKRESKLAELLLLKEIYNKVISDRNCVSLQTLAVSGKDLIATGMEPGPMLGMVLKNLLEMVLNNPDLNTKDQLLEISEEIRRIP